MSYVKAGSLALTTGLMVCLPALGAVPTQEQVDAMEATCEAKRTEVLAPLREEKTQQCIEAGEFSAEHCQNYYSTYGNVGAIAAASPPPMGFDLPECQAWLQAREELQQSHSQP
ncbi:MAG: hypothetical protein AAGA91_13195 [Pseudomonadota bacterium]